VTPQFTGIAVLAIAMYLASLALFRIAQHGHLQ
jgi:hypothetical protein